MTLRTFIICFFLLLLIASLYFYSEWDQENTKKAIDQKTRLITTINDPLNVKTLRMKAIELPTPICIERQNSQNYWFITAPINYEADNIIVNRIVNKLLASRIIEQFHCNRPLSEFGLAPPRLVITIADYKNTNTEIFLGDLTPNKERIYAVRPNNKEILLLPATIYFDTFRTLFDLRNKTIIDFVVSDIKRLSIKSENNTMVLTKKYKDAKISWLIEGIGEALPRAVEDLLYQIHNLQVVDFIDDKININSMGLNKPNIVITLTREDDVNLEFYVGNSTPNGKERYLQRKLINKPILLVNNESLAQFKCHPNDFLDHRVLILENDQVDEISIKYENENLVYRKENGLWQRIIPPSNSSDGEAAALFLWDLCELKWEQILEPIDIKGLDNPIAVITLNLVNKTTKQIILSQPLLYQKQTLKQTNLLAVKIEDDNRIFGVMPNFIKSIPTINKKDKA